MVFARMPKIWIWVKEKEGNDVSLTAGLSCQGRLPHDRDDIHRRFLRDGEVSGQTKGTNVIPRPHYKNPVIFWLSIYVITYENIVIT